MSISDILIVGAFVVLLIALFNANGVLSQNPYHQLKSHEDLHGRLPKNISFGEKLRLVGLFGLSPNNPGRTWLISAAVVAFLIFVLFQS